MIRIVVFLLLLTPFGTYAQGDILEKKMVLIENFKDHDTLVMTNDAGLPQMLDEFFDKARYYKVDVLELVQNLQSVNYVDENLNFIADISEDGKHVRLNKALLTYPNLAQLMLYRQFGKALGVKRDKKKGHAIMGEHWELDPQHEFYAYNLLRRPYYIEAFFKELYFKKPFKRDL